VISPCILLSRHDHVLRIVGVYPIIEIIKTKKLVVSDAVYILFLFNIILFNTTGCHVPRFLEIIEPYEYIITIRVL
jgi:hypothetical protein